jgi:DegV family protein with EDD domain
VDSANLSTGNGHLVLAAAEMAMQGKSVAEIMEVIEALRPRVRSSFVVDTLTYLHRGGRCSGVAALVGNALKLHPKIVVANGKMSPDKKYRGKMNHVIMKYVQEMEEDLKRAKPSRVFVTHSGCSEEIIQSVKEYLTQLNHFEEILITRAGSVISSHCGPGTLGVLFIAKE